MATIEFYYMPESPPCRAVEMLAGLVGVELNKHYINLSTKDQLKEDFIKLNPLHKVPFIVDGDLKLSESRAIMMYLVNKYKPDAEHLYPKDPKRRALVDEMLFYDIGTVWQTGSKLLGPVYFTGAKELNADDEKAYRETLQYLDRRLGGNGGKKFMFDNHLTIADVALAASLTLPEACGFNISEYKHLVAYLERLKSAIPNYSEVNDKAIENTKKHIQSKRE